MAKKRRRYTDQFRADAVLMLEAAGWPDQKGALTRVAEHLGISYQLLSNWARQKQNEPPQDMLQEKSFDAVEGIKQEITKILEQFDYTRDDADYRALGTVFGILVDKMQLLEGKATERVEVMDERQRAERVTKLLDTARTRRAGTADKYVQ